ncbi:MAG: GNAT family N-acetyltransferase [Anaerocolumna sp.]
MDYKLYNTINEIQSIGKSKDEIRKELYALWQECFGDTQSYTDFYFKWKVKDNRILTIYKQERLSAMLHLNPYIIMVGGKPEPLNYIVGVATRQQDRRQGLMKELLCASLCQMYDEHMPFTYLMPAAEAIYLPFGFRIVYEQDSWKQQMSRESQINNKDESIHDTAAEEINIDILESTDEKKLAELTDFTNLYLMENYDIYTVRSPYYYKRLIYEMESAKGRVLLCRRNENIIGYVSFMTDGGLGIAECIYRPEEKEDFMKAVSGEILDTDLNMDIGHTNPTIMARIVDWRSFIKNITAREDITLNIKVEDSIIKENNGVYQLQFTSLGCKVIKTDARPELTADIADLTKLFLGRLSEGELIHLIKQEDSKNIVNKIDKVNVYKELFINDVV